MKAEVRYSFCIWTLPESQGEKRILDFCMQLMDILIFLYGTF